MLLWNIKYLTQICNFNHKIIFSFNFKRKSIFVNEKIKHQTKTCLPVLEFGGTAKLAVVLEGENEKETNTKMFNYLR